MKRIEITFRAVGVDAKDDVLQQRFMIPVELMIQDEHFFKMITGDYAERFRKTAILMGLLEESEQ